MKEKVSSDKVEWSLHVVNKKTFKKEISRLSAIANKRMKRLEKNKLTDSPAYKRLVENGIVKFGVRGKTYNELQREMSNLNRFLNSETSTIRGINKNLKTIAKNTNIKYKNLKELKAKSSAFFELSSKVEQYLTNVEDMGSAVGYNQIWEVIDQYVSSQSIDLSDANNSIDDIVVSVSDILSNVKSDKDLYDLKDGSDWVLLE